jgi:branched-chain amino acid transport system ATP-binding protein
MLRLENVSVFYGAFQVLWDVSLDIPEGTTACVLGPNGAGKSTVLKAIAGLVPVRGRVLFHGKDISKFPAARRVSLGMSLVLERRRLFAGMTARENLLLGGYQLPRMRRDARLREVIALVPGVEALLAKRAGDLSGGQQQLIAIARGLMAEPSLLLLDEPFLGLSPKAVNEVEGIIASLGNAGMTIVFNEQNVRKSLAMSDTAVLLEGGRLIAAGPSGEIGAGDIVQRVYFGTHAGTGRPA